MKKRMIDESSMDADYIADIIYLCKNNGVQCIVDDNTGDVLVYDASAGRWTTSDIMDDAECDVADILKHDDLYEEVMQPMDSDETKEFMVKWNALQKKDDTDGVFKTEKCEPVRGAVMERQESDQWSSSKGEVDEDTVEGIPNWAASYIMYGEPDGLSDEDIKLVDKFIEELDEDGLVLDSPIDGTENEFNSHPAFGDACDTQDWSCSRNMNESGLSDDRRDWSSNEEEVEVRWLVDDPELGIYIDSTETFVVDLDLISDFQDLIDEVKHAIKDQYGSRMDFEYDEDWMLVDQNKWMRRFGY